jgi:hypothetical protein
MDLGEALLAAAEDCKEGWRAYAVGMGAAAAAGDKGDEMLELLVMAAEVCVEKVGLTQPCKCAKPPGL